MAHGFRRCCCRSDRSRQTDNRRDGSGGRAENQSDPGTSVQVVNIKCFWSRILLMCYVLWEFRCYCSRIFVHSGERVVTNLDVKSNFWRCYRPHKHVRISGIMRRPHGDPPQIDGTLREFAGIPCELYGDPPSTLRRPYVMLRMNRASLTDVGWVKPVLQDKWSETKSGRKLSLDLDLIDEM